MNMRSFLYCLFMLFALLAQSCIGGEIEIVNLRTEYLTEPTFYMGIRRWKRMSTYHFVSDKYRYAER